MTKTGNLTQTREGIRTYKTFPAESRSIGREEKREDFTWGGKRVGRKVGVGGGSNQKGTTVNIQNQGARDEKSTKKIWRKTNWLKRGAVCTKKKKGTALSPLGG